MNYSIDRQRVTAVFLLLMVALSSGDVFGQSKPKWYVTGGLGGATMRDVGTTFGDLQYDIQDNNASLRYELDAKPSLLIEGGAGLSGRFTDAGLVGWEVGLNVRSAGFKLTPRLIEQRGELSSIYRDLAPDFGKTQKMRYWAVHMPVSLTYLPFEYVGFKIGADFYYQFSSNITTDKVPFGTLGRAMGMTTHYQPRYKYPFQMGAHLGVFVPINDRVRVDLDFFTDITPRLRVTPANPGVSDFTFREMGAKLSTRYYLK